MNSKTINQETIENILKADDIDIHTAKVLEQAKAHVDFIHGLNLEIYNINGSSSMRQIVDYRIDTLEKSGRTFYGAKECTLKLGSISFFVFGLVRACRQAGPCFTSSVW